ncbi:hypothetical protein BX661DRAFT_179214 [Kickxella alabastrina]|uniref:uncharacterized protein n=1 Tax=Kickxella alabastrina TaxID=61397 RepID=UPI002220F9DD|nr:uncharacterized protein BX661DRAFT_179214 [Kickxella alabastrina]KAI7833123.1 hypothetical protein BX661DRAFT_179214 [Kickxella alabastrina]
MTLAHLAPANALGAKMVVAALETAEHRALMNAQAIIALTALVDDRGRWLRLGVAKVRRREQVLVTVSAPILDVAVVARVERLALAAVPSEPDHSLVAVVAYDVLVLTDGSVLQGPGHQRMPELAAVARLSRLAGVAHARVPVAPCAHPHNVIYLVEALPAAGSAHRSILAGVTRGHVFTDSSRIARLKGSVGRGCRSNSPGHSGSAGAAVRRPSCVAARHVCRAWRQRQRVVDALPCALEVAGHAHLGVVGSARDRRFDLGDLGINLRDRRVQVVRSKRHYLHLLADGKKKDLKIRARYASVFVCLSVCLFVCF